jgi:cyclopropane fatty-acyl-phospholipid synthase-like methyltransferase
VDSTTFERVVDPNEYMLRLALSPIGQTYKSLALSQLRLGPGDAVLDLGCGPGADLVEYADAAVLLASWSASITTRWLSAKPSSGRLTCRKCRSGWATSKR